MFFSGVGQRGFKGKVSSAASDGDKRQVVEEPGGVFGADGAVSGFGLGVVED